MHLLCAVRVIMKCPKCEGRGWNDNQRYWNAKAKYQTDYYLRFEPTVKCGNCKGSGYIIGNVKDVLDFLRHLEKGKFMYDKEYAEQTRQCINAIDETYR